VVSVLLLLTSLCVSFFFSFSSYIAHSSLHSFPTRRSSDLDVASQQVPVTLPYLLLLAHIPARIRFLRSETSTERSASNTICLTLSFLMPPLSEHPVLNYITT